MKRFKKLILSLFLGFTVIAVCMLVCSTQVDARVCEDVFDRNPAPTYDPYIYNYSSTGFTYKGVSTGEPSYVKNNKIVTPIYMAGYVPNTKWVSSSWSEWKVDSKCPQNDYVTYRGQSATEYKIEKATVYKFENRFTGETKYDTGTILGVIWKQVSFKGISGYRYKLKTMPMYWSSTGQTTVTTSPLYYSLYYTNGYPIKSGIRVWSDGNKHDEIWYLPINHYNFTLSNILFEFANTSDSISNTLYSSVSSTILDTILEKVPGAGIGYDLGKLHGTYTNAKQMKVNEALLNIVNWEVPRHSNDEYIIKISISYRLNGSIKSMQIDLISEVNTKEGNYATPLIDGEIVHLDYFDGYDLLKKLLGV